MDAGEGRRTNEEDRRVLAKDGMKGVSSFQARLRRNLRVCVCVSRVCLTLPVVMRCLFESLSPIAQV